MIQEKWTKLGQLYEPASTGRHPKLRSHAANPLPVHLEDDVYRIFFSGRDEFNRSSVGAVDIDIVRRRIVQEHYYPFFVHGPEGSFYADGVSIGNVYEVNGVRYMLFMGWQAPKDGHWRGDIGRLTVTPAALLELNDSQPFLGVDETDLISLSYPWVQASRQGGFEMWYGSTRTWDAGNGEMLHVIHRASSADGHLWHRTGLAVPYQLGQAQAFSRPTVACGADAALEMWFSYRSGAGEKYRIGYARKENEDEWVLMLESKTINISASGWDSEMIEYPFVFDHRDRRYMLYNGNGYGRTGFGLAVLDSVT